MRPRKVMALVIACLGSACANCWAAHSSPSLRVLRAAYANDPVSFDPDNAFQGYGLDALQAVYQGLVRYSPGSTRIVGWLAENWTVSADGRTYIFSLHKGVRFHSGKELTADDVLAYFHRRMSPELALSYSLAGIESMDAPDRWTFIIRLREPHPDFLDRLASAWGPKIVGPDALTGHAGHDRAASWLDWHEDGTGPYRLSEVKRGYRYVLARDPAYWGPRPYFDRIEISVIPSIGQQMLMLQRGELDIVNHGYPFDQARHASAPLKVQAEFGLGLEMATVNTTRALRDPQLRRAVLTAINPKRWLEDAFAGFAVPARSLYPRRMINATSPVSLPDEVAEARRIIQAHGKVAVEIGYGTDEVFVQQRTAELLASALHAIGIDSSVRAIAPADYIKMKYDPSHAPDLWISQIYPDAAHPATQAQVFFHSKAPFNLFGHSNADVDAAIERAGTILDIPQRDELYLKVSDRLINDVAFVPLADIKDLIVYRADLQDLNVRPAVMWTVDYGTIRRE